MALDWPAQQVPSMSMAVKTSKAKIYISEPSTDDERQDKRRQGKKKEDRTRRDKRNKAK